MSEQHTKDPTQHSSATNNDQNTQRQLPHHQHRTHHRKRSTFASSASSQEAVSSSTQQNDTTDDANQQQTPSDDVSVDLPTPPPSPVGTPHHLSSSYSRSAEYNTRILAAKRSGNLRAVMMEFTSMKKQHIPLTHHTYNVVLDAHATLRREGTPLNYILKRKYHHETTSTIMHILTLDI